LYIKITPQNTLHPETAMIPIALEFKHNRFGFEYEQAFKINSFVLNWNYNKSNLKYYRIQLNVRFYLKNENKNKKHFVGFNFSYLPFKYDKENDWYKKNGNYYRYTTSNINIKQFYYRIFYGLSFSNETAFNFELITGFGIKNIIVTHNTKQQKKVNNQSVNEEWFSQKDRYVGSRIKPSVLICLRIGYKLFSSKNKKR